MIKLNKLPAVFENTPCIKRLQKNSCANDSSSKNAHITVFNYYRIYFDGTVIRFSSDRAWTLVIADYCPTSVP